MIAHIKGLVKSKAADHVVVDVGGVGYQIAVSLNALYEIPPEEMEVSLHVHTHIREDAWQLFGFLNVAEKNLFQQLLKVNGVGPKLAMTILSGRTVQEINRAIAGQDAALLKAIPGIGQKTAERILVDLKGKIGPLVGDPLHQAAQGRGNVLDEALSALTHLGYTRPQAELALSRVEKRETLALKEIVRQGLKNLARN